jgi:hypothetical protein
MQRSDVGGRHNETIRIGRSTRQAILLGAAMLLQACGSDAVEAPTGVALSGSVALQDAWANDLGDYSGVAVSVDGLSAHAVTDKSGAWHIDDLPAGRYDITLEKATFGTMRILGQDVAGPSTAAPSITMATTPTSQAIIDSIHVVSLSGTDFYFVDGHYSAPPPANAKETATVLFVSAKGEAVSADPATYDQWDGSLFIAGGSSTFTFALPAAPIQARFGAGTTLFLAAYATSVSCSCYDDPTTHNRVFSNAGPRGNVMRLTVR